MKKARSSCCKVITENHEIGLDAQKGERTTYTHICPKTAPQETPEETVHGKLGFTWRRQARERTESHLLFDLLDAVYEHFNNSVSARLQRPANRLNQWRTCELLHNLIP